MDPEKKQGGGHRRNMSMKTMMSIDIENLRQKYEDLEQTAQVREDEYKQNLGQLEETLKEATKQVQSLSNKFENKEK